MSTLVSVENMPLKKPRRKWDPPTEKFSSETTAKQDFIAKGNPPRTSFKPSQKPLKSEDPFDGNTGYKNVYVAHPVQPRKPKERKVHVPPAEKFDATSTAKNDFRGDVVPKRESYKRDTEPFKSNADFESTTTAGKDYKSHPVERRIARKPEEYTKPEGKIDLDTVNRSNYKEHPIQKQIAKKPSSSKTLRGEGEVEKDTNYIKDYPAWEPKRPEKVTQNSQYLPPDGKMDGITTSKRDYPPLKGEVRKGFKPKESELKSTDPLDTHTGYKNTYVEHPLQPKQGRQREEYKPPAESLDSLSTNKQDFQGLTVPKRKNYKRDTEAFRSDEPIDDSTTSALDYKGYTAKRPEIKRQTGTLKSVGDMDIDTVNAQTYREFPLQRSVAKRPTSSDALKGTGNFEGHTGYNDVYREHKIAPRESMKKNDYVPPDGKFDGETTSRLDYPGQTVPKRESFKPSGDALKSDDPFDAYTGYKNTYVEHPLQPKQGRRREEYQPPTETMDSLSTNKQDFQGLTVAKRKSYKRDTEEFRSDEPIDDSTTSALDYKGYTANRPEIKRQTGNLKPEGDMDIDTVNAQTYRAFPSQKRVAKRPTSSNALKGTGYFEGHTGYNDVYREHKIAPRESMKKNDYVPPDGKFDGETTSRLDYPGQTVPKRDSFKPSGDALRSDDPFDANTGYKNTYVEHPLQPKQGRRRDEYQPPTETMDSLSTNKQDFQGLTVPKRKNYNRDTEAFRSDEPIDDSTTSALDYKGYTAQRPEIKRQTGNLKPEGDMDTDTVNAQTYREFPLQKRVAKRPTSSDALKGTGNFEGNTGYNDVYREHKIAPRESMKKNDYVPPDGKFDGETTSRLDYPGQIVPKRESFKPSGDALKSDDPFDANTGYTNTYVEHPLQPKRGRRRDEYQPPTETMDSLSTNKQDFQGLTVAKRKSYKRDTEAFRSDEPIDDSTTSALDYKGYTAQRPEIKRQTGNLKPEGDMDIDTVNAQTYREFPLQKRVAKRPTSSDALKGTGNFEGHTGYNDVYREHKIAPRESMKKNDYVPPDGKFDGETTSRLDYPGQTVPKRDSFKPSGDALRSDDPFDANTGYKNTYVEHPLQPKHDRRRDEYQPPTETMDSLSTSKQDFQGLAVPKRKSYKRDTEAFRSDEPIDDSTTSALDYKGYTAQRPEIKRQTGNLKPEGDMDIDTVNAQTYRAFPSQKRVAKRPTSSDALKGTGNFEGHTGYNDVYREHKIAPRESMKKNDYVPPDGKFDGETTSRLDYPGQTVPKRESFKPSGDALRSDDPFDANTGYKNTYVEHPLQPKQGRRRDEYQPPTETMDSLSTNKQDFQGLTVPKRKNYNRDTEAFRSDEPIDDSTTSALDYKGYTVQRPEIKRQTGNLKPEGDMDIDTVNAQTYREFPLQKRVAKRPTSSDALKGTGNFEGHTGYNDVYREHKIAPRESMKKNDYVPPDGKFDGETTSRLDYPGQTVPKRESFKPSDDAFKSEDPFDANTGYKNTYVEHPLQPKQGRRCDEYQPPTETMDSLSTNKQDFQGLTVPKRKSYKRDTEAFRSDEPIDDSTTSALDYKGYTSQRPEIKRQTGNLKLEGDMDIDTVNAQTYRELPLNRSVAKRPASSDALKGTGNFEGFSGYNDVYKEHKITPRESMKKNEYHPPEVKFEGETTSRLDYTGQVVAKRGSFRPVGDSLKSDQPFDSFTENRDAYIQYNMPTKQIRSREVYLPPSERMETVSTNKQDFLGIPGQKRQSYKRDTEPYSSGAPLDDATTFAQDFKTWAADRPAKKSQVENLKLEGDMDLYTVNQHTYRGEIGAKRSIKKYGSSNALGGDGKFHGASGYGASFQEYELKPRQSHKQVEYVAPEGKFEGETTSKLDYQQQPPSKRTKIIPVESFPKSHDPFAPNTGYQETYVRHQAAAKILREKEQYVPPTVPLEAVTTNKQDYQSVTTPKRAGFGPSKEPFRSDAPFDGNTTARGDYKQWAVDKGFTKRQDTYVKSNDPMDLQTTSDISYRGEPIRKRSGKRPRSSNTLKYDGKFHGESIYRGSFTQQELPAKEVYKKQQYVPPLTRFEGETTSRVDFGIQPLSKTKNFKTTESALRSSVPMIADSIYKDSFAQPPVTTRPRREPQAYIPSSVPFEGVSTSRSDFLGTSGEKRVPYRPTKEAFQSNARFDGTTTFSSDFKGALGGGRSQRIMRETYQANTAPFDGSTTSRDAFTGQKGVKPRSFKPSVDSFLKSTEKFVGSSTYRGSFETGQSTNWSGPQTILSVA